MHLALLSVYPCADEADVAFLGRARALEGVVGGLSSGQSRDVKSHL